MILPEPDIPDSERWKTRSGKEYYPYVRMLGGVSLFDFSAFDPEIYSHEYPLSTWREFVPFRSTWNCAVWIEIDRKLVTDQLITGPDLVTRWKQDQAHGHTIMPYIEAAHIGPIPQRSFKRAFLVRDRDDSFHDLRLEVEM